MFNPTNVFAANKKIQVKTVGETITLKSNKKGKSYQWQMKSKKKWKNIKGKKRTLNIKATWNKNNAKYRCAVTKKNGKTVYSNTFTLRIEKNPVITEQPENQYTRKGGFVDFETNANGGNELIYTWYTSTDRKSWKEAGIGKRLRYVPKSESLYVRCKVYNKITGGSTYTQIVRLYITDEKTKYYRSDLPEDAGKGVFKPKALDKYIYVYSYGSKFTQQIKNACKKINANIGKNTFIYTDAPYIADIIIMDYNTSENNLGKNIFTKNGTQEYLNKYMSDSDDWGGVTFSDSVYGQHFLIELNEAKLIACKNSRIIAVIVHEIGHAIGINAHAKETTSIMHSPLTALDMSTADIKLFKEKIEQIENMENKYFS